VCLINPIRFRTAVCSNRSSCSSCCIRSMTWSVSAVVTFKTGPDSAEDRGCRDAIFDRATCCDMDCSSDPIKYSSAPVKNNGIVTIPGELGATIRLLVMKVLDLRGVRSSPIDQQFGFKQAPTIPCLEIESAVTRLRLPVVHPNTIARVVKSGENHRRSASSRKSLCQCSRLPRFRCLLWMS
jgi:hypothetical protein